MDHRFYSYLITDNCTLYAFKHSLFHFFFSINRFFFPIIIFFLFCKQEQVYKSHHYGKSTVGEFLNPVNGIRGRMERHGIKPRDHARENVVALREKQRENRERQAIETNPKPLNEWKMAQFKDVKSKISTNRTPNDYPENNGTHDNQSHPRGSGDGKYGGGEDEVKPFLRKGSLDGRLQQAREAKMSPRRDSPRKDKVKQAVPKVYETAKLAPRKNTNFIASNRDGARSMISPRKQQAHDEGKRHSDFGNVPQYIRERRIEEQEREEARLASLPDPNCPPGMKLMCEKERLDMLAILKENEKDVHVQLSKLPLRPTTMSMIKRKEDLHAKLLEIEGAQKIFSKPKVFVEL